MKQCTLCGKPVNMDDFTDELSVSEFGISGACQVCQNDLWKSFSDDEDDLENLEDFFSDGRVEPDLEFRTSEALEVNGYKCKPMLRKYQDNGNTAIELIVEDSQECYAIATVNLDRILAPDLAFIKTYGGQEEILENLMKAGIVIEVVDYEETGFVEVPLVRLNLDLLGVDQFSQG